MQKAPKNFCAMAENYTVTTWTFEALSLDLRIWVLFCSPFIQSGDCDNRFQAWLPFFSCRHLQLHNRRFCVQHTQCLCRALVQFPTNQYLPCELLLFLIHLSVRIIKPFIFSCCVSSSSLLFGCDYQNRTDDTKSQKLLLYQRELSRDSTMMCELKTIHIPFENTESATPHALSPAKATFEQSFKLIAFLLLPNMLPGGYTKQHHSICPLRLTP